VSYNIKKLTDYGYLVQERALHDKRSVTVKLTDKGKKVVEGVRALEQQNGAKLDAVINDSEAIASAAELLRKLERTWDDYIRYGE